MIAVALCALFLTPLIWMYRRLELQVTRERMAAEYARAQADRALYAAQVRSAQAAFNTSKTSNNNQPIWAALSINHPVLTVGQTKDLRIEFSLINDGDKVIDPKIAKSRIVINDKEIADSGLVLSSVAKEDRFKVLAPGESLQFDCLLGDHFKVPGRYRVSWKGSEFQAPEIVVRIMPDKTH